MSAIIIKLPSRYNRRACDADERTIEDDIAELIRELPSYSDRTSVDAFKSAIERFKFVLEQPNGDAIRAYAEAHAVLIEADTYANHSFVNASGAGIEAAKNASPASAPSGRRIIYRVLRWSIRRRSAIEDACMFTALGVLAILLIREIIQWLAVSIK